MSLYADYLGEQIGHYVLETQYGFATYSFPYDKTVYIMDIYVIPDYRKQNIGGDMADTIKELAKKRGCTRMIGSVKPSVKNSTISLKVLLGYGMKLDSCTNDYILFSKEI